MHRLWLLSRFVHSSSTPASSASTLQNHINFLKKNKTKKNRRLDVSCLISPCPTLPVSCDPSTLVKPQKTGVEMWPVEALVAFSRRSACPAAAFCDIERVSAVLENDTMASSPCGRILLLLKRRTNLLNSHSEAGEVSCLQSLPSR